MTTFRDLEFERPFQVSDLSSFRGPINSGEQYGLGLRLPVNRPVEAITTFKTMDVSADNPRFIVVDSLVYRDTFLLQGASDTLQQRLYTY